MRVLYLNWKISNKMLLLPFLSQSVLASVLRSSLLFVPISLSRSLKCFFSSFLLLWVRSLFKLGCDSHWIRVAVEALVVPWQCTILREWNITGLTPKGPQIDVSLEVHDKICAFIEYLMTVNAIRADKLALIMRHGVIIAFSIDEDLFVRIRRKNFQARIIYTLRNRRPVHRRWNSPWASMTLWHLPLSVGRLMYRVLHWLCHKSAAIAIWGELGVLRAVLDFLTLLLLDTK